MPSNRLEFQQNGMSIWITIPPKVGCEIGSTDSSDSEMEDTTIPKVVSLDNLYSATAERNQEQGRDLSNSKLPFLWKLYQMLEDVESSNQDDIVSWVNDGKAFKVHQIQAFVKTIIPQYSKVSKYKSFQRQLYFYGFVRIQSGKCKGAYHHPSFVRGKKSLCLHMTPKNTTHRRRQQQQLQENAKRKEAAHLALERTASAPAATTSSDLASAGAIALQVALGRSQTSVPPETTPNGPSSQRGSFPVPTTSNSSCIVEATLDDEESLDFFSGMPFHCL